MGNNLALDADQENFRLAIRMLEKKLENYDYSKKFIKQKKILHIIDEPYPILLLEFNYIDIMQNVILNEISIQFFNYSLKRRKNLRNF